MEAGTEGAADPSGKNVSFTEACKIAVAEQTPPKTLASIASSGMQSSTPVKLKSVEVQTEFTWPCATEQPSHIAHVSKRSTATKSTTTEDVGSGAEDKSKTGGKNS